MAENSFGQTFRFTTYGESHGPALGCVVDGCPAGIPLTEADIQTHLDRRKPGQSRYTTQRKEADEVAIQSGVFEGLTTGTPIGLTIQNTDQRSKDYGDIADKFRPGHADYTYWAKYGMRDYRGGGRASARETAMRVAAGGVARQVLAHHPSLAGRKPIEIKAAVTQIGPHGLDRDNWDWDQVDQNPFFSPDAKAAENWADYLDQIRKGGLSAGAVIECVAMNVPPGLGSPVYGKLDAELAGAMMSINAAKAVEIGAGFATAALDGAENADEIRIGDDGKPLFSSNKSGGILGGISSGQEIVVRLAIKPTSSILTPRKTINRFGEEVEIVTKGRHDPCVGIRGVPVAEAMMACVLADHLLRHLAGGDETAFDRPWDQRD
ncbi:MAG: chorismate synthase [Pseudomonadota bacterium]